MIDDAYNAVFEALDILYPNEEGVVNMCRYVGVDDAVGFIYYSEFMRDEEEMRSTLGKEIANPIIEHYNLHCK